MSCGLCQNSICKDCTEFLDPDTFSFKKDLAEELRHPRYCSLCFSNNVQPALWSYKEVMSRAQKVIIIDRPQRRPLPVLKSSEQILTVTDCTDREETFLRLAFLAAEQGFNAVIKTKVESKKIRNFGYQKMSWQGTGFPASLDAARLSNRS